MALIGIENMRFFAHHGLYEEEQILGNRFSLDVYIETNIEEAQAFVENETEQLAHTINYETVFEICKIEMAEPEKLLETVIEKIIYAIKKQFQTIEIIKVRLSKYNPPMNGQVDKVFLEDTHSFATECNRCEKGMLCYNDDSCWCFEQKKKIHPRTMEMIQTQFKHCICQKCLLEYTG
jgi:7,8-dihydroneopterin aldolase/epimerase/oxygenase